MCGQKFCLENSILSVKDGETVFSGSVHDRYTGFYNSAKERRHVPNGASIVMDGIPKSVRMLCDVEVVAPATFVETKQAPYDFVKFEKGKVVSLDQIGHGVRFDIVKVCVNQDLKPQPPKTTNKKNLVGQLVAFVLSTFSMLLLP